MPAPDDTLTVPEVARLLGRDVCTTRRMIDRGVLPSTRTPGGHRRIPREAVEAYDEEVI